MSVSQKSGIASLHIEFYNDGKSDKIDQLSSQIRLLQNFSYLDKSPEITS